MSISSFRRPVAAAVAALLATFALAATVTPAAAAPSLSNYYLQKTCAAGQQVVIRWTAPGQSALWWHWTWSEALAGNADVYKPSGGTHAFYTGQQRAFWGHGGYANMPVTASWATCTNVW